MTEAVRPAVADDLGVVADLYAAATAELGAQRGGEVWRRRAPRTAPPSLPDSDEQALLLVGTIDDVVVGYAEALVEAVEDGGRLAVLRDVYVEEAARGVGLGELLLDDVLGWAVEQGCFGIDSLALPGMRASKNFFETAGMVARAIVVHRSLP